MRLLAIEDEPELAELLRRNLTRDGFAVDLAASLDEAEAALAATRYDAILLDRGLPDGDGLDLLRRRRAMGDATPVLVLTARDALGERVEGLNDGADDYLAKPFAQEELTARIGALLRRPGAALGRALTLGRLSFDAATRAVSVDGRSLIVPRRELAALEALLRRAGRVVTRDALDNALYANGEETESNALEAHMSRLRKRLAEAGAGVAIVGVRGVGYLAKAEEAS